MYRRLLRKRLLNQRRFRLLLLSMLGFSLGLGLIIMPIEQATGNIKTPLDGVWWAISTMTTVGYGDYVPVTTLGRLIGILLQLVGTMMFGMVVAMMAAYLNKSQEEFFWRRLFDRLDQMDHVNQQILNRSGYIVRKKEEKSASDKG